MQKIIPFFWYDHQAEEAANFYTSIFKNSSVGKIMRQGDKALTVDFKLGDYNFMGLNGGPLFKINPSISIFAMCETVEDTDAAWAALSEGGKVMMPYDKYPWSEKYGWLEDKYGVSWQILVSHPSRPGLHFAPSLMFTGVQHGKAEAAINLYTSLFKNASIDGIARYEEGEGDPAIGTIKHAEFRLDGCLLMAMDSSHMHAFQFNEAVSLMVNCKDQQEVDFLWEKLTTDGGEESQCGWLKDKFGVSWQIIPTEMFQLFSDPDPARVQRAMGAMMQMKKLDLAKMKAAADDPAARPVVTIEAIVDAPLEKVWDFWSAPKHIMQWNSASPDWHTPRAENDLRKGGSFSSRMEAKDGSFGFDFGGVYDEVIDNQLIEYTMGDGRKVSVHFTKMEDGSTHVMESFEAESQNPVDMQRQGWQSILDNFKKYVESN